MHPREDPDLAGVGVARGRPGEDCGRGRGVVGREVEVAALADFLTAGRSTPRALVLDGEAGIGKTTLFDAAVLEARAQGFAVFACRPAAAEAAFSFAALGDLLAPVLPQALGRLPSPQRRALSAALLLEEVEGPAPDERAIAYSVFRVLGEHEGGPVLIAVDDAQWLDAASASVLAFALRRLAAAPVAILVARRSSGDEAAPLGLDRALPAELLRRMRVGPLSVGAIHRLLRERLGVSFPRPALIELHETSGGNPFYALELGRALEQSGGRTGAGARLSIPRSLTELVSARLAALPEEARDVLDPAALLGRPTVSILEAVLSDTATVLGRLRTAEAAGILELNEERVAFTHPLLAAQVDAELDPRRRRSLHRRLAELVDDPEQRARHLALAAEGTDASAAQELEAAAGVAARRGALGAAAELAEFAASLTPDDGEAGVRRRLLAAELHHGSGDPTRARAILEPLGEQLPPGPFRAEVLTRLATIWDHDFEEAERLFERARAEAGPDVRLRAGIVVSRMLPVFLRHGPAAAVRLGRENAEVVERCGDELLLAHFLSELAFAELCAAELTQARLERALALEERLGPLPHAITPTLVLGLRALWADEPEAARAALERADRVALERGDDGARANALLFLAELDWRTGNWRRAEEYAAQLLELAEQRGLDYQGGAYLWLRAFVDAHLGRLEEARTAATEGAARSRAGEDHAFLERNLALLGFIELSEGDHRAAAELLAPVVRRREARGAREPSLYPARELAIEALVGAGDLEEARVQLEWLEDAGRRLATPWPLALGARCRGLLRAAEGDLQAALASCEQALQVHERMPAPFERARTLLAYGTILRRGKRRKAAREAIEAARTIFEALPAPVWADNARAELARIGGRAASGGGLTPSERRIAELVAAGKSNKEAAAALFLSVHTVEDALKRIYGKLDVRSRTELSRRLDSGS